jgi:hypothetical protein
VAAAALFVPPTRLAMLFFLDTIEETYNNGPPLALYKKNDLVHTLNLVKKIVKTFGYLERDM